MTVEEAIEAIKLDGVEIKGKCIRINEFLEGLAMAEESLEKQVPKKIEEWNGQASCPCCEKLFGNIDTIKKLVYWEMECCNKCGQKLDWSEIRLVGK